MRFGIQTAQLNASTDELLDVWRLLDEETAFDSVWLMDHLVAPLDGQLVDVPCFEAWSLLGAAAHATRRVRLGALVSANSFRHPSLLAKMAATVDHLSGGRVALALGAGWYELEHRAFGLHLGSLTERLDRLEEAAALLRSVIDADGRVSMSGKHYRLEDAPFLPGFAQPAPPLMIGGGGERRTLRIVARHADVANVMGPVCVVAHKLAVLREHCRDVGRDPSALDYTVHMPIALSDDADEIERLRAFLVDHYDMTPEQAQCEAPVGTAAHVRDVLSRYAEVGVSALILPAPAPWSPDVLRRLDDEVVRPLADVG